MENSFYNYPLLIKQLLISPLSSNPEQEIVDYENQRYDYKRLNTNIHTLANALREIGIKKGDTIGIMAWDTIRYLEFFFAIPMMGAILHTINIRLSEQQILYTINHADDDLLIVHHDFIEVMSSEFNIKVIVQYYPLNRYDMFQKAGFGEADIPVTDNVFDNMISFPFHSWMSDEQFEYMIESTIMTLNRLR